MCMICEFVLLKMMLQMIHLLRIVQSLSLSWHIFNKKFYDMCCLWKTKTSNSNSFLLLPSLSKIVWVWWQVLRHTHLVPSLTLCWHSMSSENRRSSSPMFSISTRIFRGTGPGLCRRLRRASGGLACLTARSCLDVIFAQWEQKEFIMDPNSNGLWLTLGKNIAIKKHPPIYHSDVSFWWWTILPKGKEDRFRQTSQRLRHQNPGCGGPLSTLPLLWWRFLATQIVKLSSWELKFFSFS